MKREIKTGLPDVASKSISQDSAKTEESRFRELDIYNGIITFCSWYKFEFYTVLNVKSPAMILLRTRILVF